MAKKRPEKRQKSFRKTRCLLKIIFLAALVAFFYAPIARNVGAVAAWATNLLEDYHYQHIASFGIYVPTRYEVHGIDVSRYQGRIDWEKVAAMQSDGIDISFAYIKASEGMLLVDRYFKRNWRESKLHGIHRGAYHYFKPHVNGKVQAHLFLRTVKHEQGDLPPVVDVEETGRLSPAELRKRLMDYIKVIEEDMGVKPIIYTGLSFYEDYLEGYFDQYPYWIAHYYRSKPRLRNELKWEFWQHSDKGRVEGIGHVVDFNVFSGEEADLLELGLPEVRSGEAAGFTDR